MLIIYFKSHLHSNSPDFISPLLNFSYFLAIDEKLASFYPLFHSFFIQFYLVVTVFTILAVGLVLFIIINLPQYFCNL